jgi:hypothetical protein
MEEQAIRRHIVKRLFDKNAFVHGHLLKERLIRGIPSHLRGTAKQVLKALLKEELVRSVCSDKIWRCLSAEC